MPTPEEHHLLNLSSNEISDLFDRYVAELDKAASLTIVAATEAALRVDFNNRVAQRLKDGASRKFREIRRSRGSRVRLDEDILEAWGEHLRPAKQAISDFRGVLRFRDWLAHGRYWVPKLGRDYQSADVYVASTNLVLALPLSE